MDLWLQVISFELSMSTNISHSLVGKNTVVHAAEARLKIDLVTLKFFPFYEP